MPHSHLYRKLSTSYWPHLRPSMLLGFSWELREEVGGRELVSVLLTQEKSMYYACLLRSAIDPLFSNAIAVVNSRSNQGCRILIKLDYFPIEHIAASKVPQFPAAVSTNKLNSFQNAFAHIQWEKRYDRIGQIKQIVSPTLASAEAKILRNKIQSFLSNKALQSKIRVCEARLESGKSRTVIDYDVFFDNIQLKSKHHVVMFDFDETLTKFYTYALTKKAKLNIHTLFLRDYQGLCQYVFDNLRNPIVMKSLLNRLLNEQDIQVAIVTFHDNEDFIYLTLKCLLNDDALLNKIRLICINNVEDRKYKKVPQTLQLVDDYNLSGTDTITLIDNDLSNCQAVANVGCRAIHVGVFHSFQASVPSIDDKMFTERLLQGLPTAITSRFPEYQYSSRAAHTPSMR